MIHRIPKYPLRGFLKCQLYLLYYSPFPLLSSFLDMYTYAYIFFPKQVRASYRLDAPLPLNMSVFFLQDIFLQDHSTTAKPRKLRLIQYCC